MRAIGNLLWFLLGGCLRGLAWWLGKTEVASAARRANMGASVAASRRGSAGTV